MPTPKMEMSMAGHVTYLASQNLACLATLARHYINDTLNSDLAIVLDVTALYGFIRAKNNLCSSPL